MKQTEGQIYLNQYIQSVKDSRPFIITCRECVCEKCLYRWSGRCPYGKCYDDKRAKENPYDKAHPDEPPRTGWTNWKADQAFWCRGGAYHPVSYCREFVKYRKPVIKDCLNAVVAIYQDGYVRCSLVDTIGCEECYRHFEERMGKCGKI